MPKHDFNRSIGARLLSKRGAVVLGTFAALTFGAVTGTAQAADTAAPAAATAAVQASPSAGTATYTVVSGDTLIGIARSQQVAGGWQAIASANGIAAPYTIHPGQVLTLPASASATATATAASAAGAQTYTDNLDGWIKHSLAVMAEHKIPGTYDGIHRNVMRESSGNPKAINLWDSNAAAGHPSIGLLQVIQPTFDAYHVPGTSTDIYDPVANITAACNYAYHVYGSIDNVNGPY
jgi:LysM repeat protein